MEEVFKRHVASDLSLTGAYKSEYGDDSEMSEVMNRVQVSHSYIDFFFGLTFLITFESRVASFFLLHPYYIGLKIDKAIA